MSFPRYPKYSASGVEWLADIPEHWRVVRLKNVCQNFPSNVDKKSIEGETSVRLCNYTDVYNNDVIRPDLPFMPATASSDQIAKFSLRAGDTIITKDSETPDDIAVSASVSTDLPGVVCGYHLAIIRPKSGAVGGFIKRFFDSAFARASFAVRANGLTRYGLSQHDIDTVAIPCPPCPEQEAIAAFLDLETAKIDTLVAEQVRLIELLKEKRQALIADAVTKGLNPDAPMVPSGFDWIGDIPEHWTLPPLYVRYDQALGKMLDQSKNTGEHPTPYLRNADVRWDHFNVEDLPIMDIEPQERKRFTVRRGDLLTVEGRELGRAAIWNGDDDIVAFQKALHRLRPLNNSEHTRYLYYTLAFANGTEVFLANHPPNEIPHLTGEQLRRYRLPKPPHPEQVAIAAFLDRETQAFDVLVLEVQRAIDLLHERRAAVISAAVTGQIDVRDLAPSEAA